MLLPSLSRGFSSSFLIRIVCCECTERQPISVVSMKFLLCNRTEFPDEFCSVLFCLLLGVEGVTFSILCAENQVHWSLSSAVGYLFFLFSMPLIWRGFPPPWKMKAASVVSVELGVCNNWPPSPSSVSI